MKLTPGLPSRIHVCRCILDFLPRQAGHRTWKDGPPCHFIPCSGKWSFINDIIPLHFESWSWTNSTWLEITRAINVVKNYKKIIISRLSFWSWLIFDLPWIFRRSIDLLILVTEYIFLESLQNSGLDWGSRRP